MSCQDAIDIMDEAIDDRLQAALRAGFEEHMTECRPCRTYLEQLRLTREGLHHLRGGGESSPRRDRLIEAFRESFGRGGSH